MNRRAMRVHPDPREPWESGSGYTTDKTHDFSGPGLILFHRFMRWTIIHIHYSSVMAWFEKYIETSLNKRKLDSYLLLPKVSFSIGLVLKTSSYCKLQYGLLCLWSLFLDNNDRRFVVAVLTIEKAFVTAYGFAA